MTTFEHALVGVTGAISCGLHRRYGWRIVAVAAVAAISPDWDGLTILGGMHLFSDAHRVWGHNLFAAAFVGAAVAAMDWWGAWTLWGRRQLGRVVRTHKDTPPSEETTAPPASLPMWLAIGVLAAYSHLAADLVYSGTETLPDWELQLWWPFSRQGYVYPLMSWGDPSASIIFACGMFAMLRWSGRVQSLALVTLAVAIVYILTRGAMG